MYTFIRSILFGLVVFTAGCYASQGAISKDDTRYFKESPKIVNRDNRYFLRFRYADENAHPFFMMTSSKIQGDSLVFYLSATSSSGMMNGKLQFEEIVNPEKLKRVKTKLVFWEDPGRKLIPLKIEDMEESFEILAASSSGKNH